MTKSYVAQRTLRDGSSPRVTIGSVAEIDLKTAREKAADLIQLMRKNINPKKAQAEAVQAKAKAEADAWTLRRALDEYVAARRDLKPGTVKDYRVAIERWLADWLDQPLVSITTEMVATRHQAIQEEIAKRRSQPPHWKSKPGANQANTTMVVLRAVWNNAGRKIKDLPRNPVSQLDRNQWFKRPRRARLVRGDQLPAFYKAVQALESQTARDYITLLLWTGLRRGEAAALTWDMCDFAGGVIRLPAEETKADRALDLPMTSFVHRLLVARRAIGNDKGWVFGADSRSGHLEEPASAFEMIAEQTGIRVSAHDMRRTYVTVAESSDVAPLAIKGLVNHSLGDDVTSGYIVMTNDRLHQAAHVVCDRLIKLCEIAEDANEKVVRTG